MCGRSVSRRKEVHSVEIDREGKKEEEGEGEWDAASCCTAVGAHGYLVFYAARLFEERALGADP